jgi:WD40 repeat protein
MSNKSYFYASVLNIGIGLSLCLPCVAIAADPAIADCPANFHDANSIVGDDIRSIDLSADGQFIALTSWSGVFLYTSDLECEFMLVSDPIHYGDGFPVDFSPDGSQIAFSSSTREGIVIVDLISGETVMRLVVDSDDPILVGEDSVRGVPPSIFSLEWSPNGRYIASLGTSPLRVWDTALNQIIFDSNTVNFYYIPTNLVSWSPDNQYLAAVSRGGVSNYTEDIVRIWDTTTWEEVQTLSSEFNVTSISWSSENDFAMSGIGRTPTLLVWDTRNWQPIEITTDLIPTVSTTFTVAWSPDGEYLALGTTGGQIYIWDRATDTILHVLDRQWNWVTDILWTPDGQALITRDMDGSVYRWNIDNECLEATLLAPPEFPELELILPYC